MAAKVGSTIETRICPLHQEWRKALYDEWMENSKLYDELNIVKTMFSIDINLKILGNYRAINYFPEAISNIYKCMCIIGEYRECKPAVHTDPYDCYPKILFAIVEAYILIWCYDGNYYRMPTYLDDCRDTLPERKLKAFYKCTNHAISVCYKIIKVDQRLLEYKNGASSTIIDIVKKGIEQTDAFTYSQFCEFFRNINELI